VQNILFLFHLVLAERANGGEKTTPIKTNTLSAEATDTSADVTKLSPVKKKKTLSTSSATTSKKLVPPDFKVWQ